MKIVALGLRGFPGIQGGVETHCEQLYTRMAAKGHDVVVLCRKPYMADVPTSYRGVALRAIASPRSRSLEAFVHTFLGVLVARRLKPDILHIHAIGPSLMVPLARLLGLRVVSTNHGPDYDRQKWGYTAKAILKAGERFGSRFSHGIIAISKPIATHLENAYGRSAALIPNGVVIHEQATGTESLENFKLAKGRYVLSVGRLVPEKAFHDLIDAFVKAKLEGWKLVIVGRADHEDGYSIGLKERASRVPSVVMTGFMTGAPLQQLYSHAGLFALPSYHEGLPIVLLEAMSYGLPALASDIPANRQVGLSSERFFKAGDVDDAAAALQRLTALDFTAEQGALQIASIRKNFDWNVIVAQTIAFYSTLLPPPRRRSHG